ncbi:MAG: sugar phosphate isomerase/epimerase family protein [Promethearchaeota archaeon]
MISRHNLALNQDSCKNFPTIEEFLRKTRFFTRVELNYYTLTKNFTPNFKLSDLIELLEIFKTKVISLHGLKDFSLSSDYIFTTTILPQLNDMMKACYKLECEMIIVYPSKIDPKFSETPFSKEKIIQRTLKRLSTLSKIAWKEDIKLGFEMLSDEDSSIKTLKETQDVLNNLTTRENVGYVLDIFHLYMSKSNLDILIKDIKDHVFLIQLCDFEETSIENAEKGEKIHRIFPGQGKFNFKNLFRLLKNHDYSGLFSIEADCDKCDSKILKQVYQFLMNF